MKVALSILTVDYKNVENDLKDIINDVDYIHLDVMDGNFVPNISFGPAFIKSIRSISDKIFDTHLMILNPFDYIKRFAEAGSDYITFHVEAKSNIMDTIKLIHDCGCKAGLAINPDTEVSKIEKYLPYLDMVLVMSVYPGFGGQSFMPNSIDKVSKLKSIRDEKNYKYLINIDGGIKDTTAPLIKDYVDMAVVGSFICNASDKVLNLEKIHKI